MQLFALDSDSGYRSFLAFLNEFIQVQLLFVFATVELYYVFNPISKSAGLAYLFTLASLFDSAGRQFADLSIP